MAAAGGFYDPGFLHRRSCFSFVIIGIVLVFIVGRLLGRLENQSCAHATFAAIGLAKFRVWVWVFAEWYG